MPVIADAAVAHIHAAGSRDRLADRIDAEWMGHMVLRVRYTQLGIDGREKAPHRPFKAQRMIQRNRTPLPVQELVHLEHVHVAPTEAFAVGDFGQPRILAHRTYRQNQARDLARPDLIGDRSREVVEEPRNIRLQMNPDSRPRPQLRHAEGEERIKHGSDGAP